MPNEKSSSLTNTIALVTGGSRGLSRDTVLHLTKRAAHAVFTSNTIHFEAEQAVAKAHKAGAKAMVLRLDVGDVRSFDSFFLEFRNTLARVGSEHFDFLTNNTSVSHHATLKQTTEAELDQLHNVNFKGVFFLTQKCLSFIKDGGRIVMISTGLTHIVAILADRGENENLGRTSIAQGASSRRLVRDWVREFQW